jgi:hypothetical protein
MSLEFADLIREGYSPDSFYGDESELARDSRIEDRRYGRRLLAARSHLYPAEL